MTENSQSQAVQNQQARRLALAGVSPAQNLAAPAVSFASAGRVLVLGPEHRIRMACARLDTVAEKVGLVTEAMPETLLPEMEAAAGLVPALTLYRLPLVALEGYLGRFEVRVSVGEERPSLAKLAFGADHFDMILDLGSEPQLRAVLKPAGYFAPAAEADYETGYEAALQALPGLKGGFEKPRYFQLNTDLCAHSSSELTGCTRCLDVCPADAIRSRDGLIQVDSHLCHGAGGCATACPTAAIRYAYPQPRLLLETLERLLHQYRQAGGHRPSLLIHDAERGRAQVQAALASLPGHWLPLEIEEMGSAGLEIWLCALALGAADVALLVDSQVPDTIRTTLARETSLANRLLEAMTLDSRVSLIAGLEAIDNREVAPVPPMAKLEAEAEKRVQISRALEHLQHHSGASPQPVALPAGAPFGGLLMDASKCTLCMACATTCPVSALTTDGERPRLAFTEADCVQCGLCTQACPEQALALQPRYLLDSEQRNHPQILKQEEPFCCVRCDKPFATQSVITLMIEKLAGHRMFDEGGLQRLKMCADCRVVALVAADPGDLFEFAQGRSSQESSSAKPNREVRS